MEMCDRQYMFGDRKSTYGSSQNGQDKKGH